MVPPPLSSNIPSSYHYSRSFIGGSISTSASPLRNSFQLSCRSPISARRPSYNQDTPRDQKTNATKTQVSYLIPSKAFPSIPETAESDVYYNKAGERSDDDEISLSEFSPSDRTWFLAPHTPALLQDGAGPVEGKLGVISAVNIIVGKTIGVGAYTVPSAIFDGVGSVGMTLLLWILGSVISFCGMTVYLDLGTAIPKSGGERVYLERIIRRPRMLATSMFMSYVVLLGFSTPNAVVLGEYLLYALGINRERWNVRVLAVLAVSSLCYIHARFPRHGLRLINILGLFKLLILAVVVISGVAGSLAHLGRHQSTAERGVPLSQETSWSTAQRNFSNIWKGSSTQPYDYATALLKVMYCFRGYNTANQVASDLKDPVRTLKTAAPIALSIASLGYIAVNVAFFLVVDKEEFKSSGVVVAGTFFRNVFGETIGIHVLPFFIMLSAAGNIAATSFAQARVNEELAKDGLLPFSRFWTTSTPECTIYPTALDSQIPIKNPAACSQPPTPSRGLLLHCLVSIAVIIIPPPGRIYNFLVDLGGYPVSVISVAISLGLLYLHLNPAERWSSPFPANRFAIIVFAVSNGLLLIFPWIPPLGGKGEGEGFVYYAYPATALAVLGLGVLWWCWWRVGGGGKDRGIRNRDWSTAREGSDSGDDEGLLRSVDDAQEGQELYENTVRRRAPCGCARDH